MITQRLKKLQDYKLQKRLHQFDTEQAEITKSKERQQKFYKRIGRKWGLVLNKIMTTHE